MTAGRWLGIVTITFAAACASSESTPTGSSASGTASTVVAPDVSDETEETDEVVPAGFSSVTARLTEPDGSTCVRCLLVARSFDDHRRGLMGATSLGGYDGMAFVYEPPKQTAFWMKDTVMPLSIRFYDLDGGSLAEFDMDPCRTEPCPTFGPDTRFGVAVEVAQGRLDELGFTDTAVLELLDDTPCEPVAGW